MTLRGGPAPYGTDVCWLLEAITDPVFVLDAHTGLILGVNEAATSLTGWTMDDLRGRHFTDLHPDSYRERAVSIFDECRAGRGARSTMVESFPLCRADRTVVFARLSAGFVEAGEDAVVFGIFRAPAPLRERGMGPEEGLDPLQVALESVSEGLLVESGDGQLLAYNEKLSEIWSIPPNTFQTRRSERFLEAAIPRMEHPEAFLNHARNLRASLANGLELIRLRDGRMIACYSRPLVEPGKPPGRVWSFRDVTDRERVTRELAQTERRFEQLAQDVHLALYELDLKAGRFDAVNDVMVEMSGYTREELLSMDPSRLLAPDQRPHFVRRLAQMRLGEEPEHTTEYRWRDKRGHESWVLVSIKIIQRETDSPRVVGAAMDIDARKQAEEGRRRARDELLRAQKYESLAVMAAGVAHDFNNLLQVILGNAELLDADLPASTPGRKALASICEAATRARVLGQQMLAFAGRLNESPERFDPAELVLSIRQRLQDAVRPGISFTVLADSCPSILADPSALERALVNLVLNAVEAIPGDREGSVEVRCEPYECRDFPSLPTFPVLRRPLGSCVRISVGDDGCGMDADTIRRAFDPFFSTRFAGRGLGLAVVLGTVQALGGVVTVDSVPDRGTLMSMLLPSA